ncbi:hypothetical protein [Yaniella halotolerans]|uniref:hypothetical protein n=1 Tax=Yaniella halotolerans TaxID=225453 RepID=UPI0003B58121|nr:hypothetical protein [Yaniella halotolerans]
MSATQKLFTTTALLAGLALSTTPAHAAVPVVSALELLGHIPISEEVSMETFAPEAWTPDPDEAPGYYRSSGCTAVQDTLIRDTQAGEQQLADDGCTLLVGGISDPYTGDAMDYDRQQDADAEPFTVDHVVSVEEAHRSGGHDWSAGRQLTFYHGGENLITVSAAEHDVAYSVLSEDQCGHVGALPAKTLAERVSQNDFVDWAQENSGVVAAVSISLVAIAILGGLALQRKLRVRK